MDLSNPRFVLLSLLLLAVASGPPLRAEGVQDGIVAGEVVDASGRPLPSVRIFLEGPQTRRETTSDTDGRFRFPALPIGNYTVTADLLGLEARETNLPVYIAKTTEVVLRLEETEDLDPADLPTTRELIQVLAVAPIIDRFETRVGSSVGREFLDEIPLERAYQSVSQLLPGVAGGGDGNPNVSGSLRSFNLFLVDGVDTTDPTTGLFGLNLSYEAVEDVDVTTAAPPTEYGRVSGGVLNVVTRSGSNEFLGSVRWLLTNNRWNGDFSDPSPHLEPELAAANRGTDDLDNTLAATLGGPITLDKVWFFAAFEQNNATFNRPTLAAGDWNQDLDLRSSTLKLNWKTNERNAFAIQSNADSASFNGFSPFDRAPGENRISPLPVVFDDRAVDPLPGDTFALEQRTQDGEFYKLEWGGTLYRKLNVTAAFAAQNRTLGRGPRNRRGLTADAPHFAALPFDFRAGDDLTFAVFNGATAVGEEERRRDQANVTADSFRRLGRYDHVLRFGFDFQRTRSSQNLTFAGQSGIDRASGRQVRGQLFVDRDRRPACVFEGRCTDFDSTTGEFQPFALFNFWERETQETEKRILSLFFNDSISFGRWLVSAGIRFESVAGENDSGFRLVAHDSIAPRLGVKFDPKGDGKVLLGATYSRFFEPFLQSYLDDFARLQLFSGYSEYRWADASFPGCASADPTDLDSFCWLFEDQQRLVNQQQAAPNPDLDRTSVEELVVSFERQLTSSTALRLSWVQRDWRDLWDDLFGFTGPNSEVGATTVENLEEAERSYQAIQLLVQKRFANRWQLLGTYTWSEAEGNLFQATGLATFADFTETTDLNLVNRFGPAPFDRTNQLRIFANYQTQIGRQHLSFGSAFRYQDGTPYQAERFEALGVRFVTPRGSERLEELWQLDLSASIDIPVTREVEIEVELEAFNLTNEQSRIGAETDLDSGIFGLPRSIADLQPPRTVRLTLGLRF